MNVKVKKDELPCKGQHVRIDTKDIVIFAYFDHPITNAYTESLNNLIRVMIRTGRGYSFEALRAKMLFTEGFQKLKRSLYQRELIPDDTIGF
ncbi:transposase [Photobacterium damselae]